MYMINIPYLSQLRHISFERTPDPLFFKKKHQIDFHEHQFRYFTILQVNFAFFTKITNLLSSKIEQQAFLIKITDFLSAKKGRNQHLISPLLLMLFHDPDRCLHAFCYFMADAA